MPYLDKHPNQFRLLFGLLSAYLLALAAATVYEVASRPTDENLFTNPQSNLYVIQNLPVVAPRGTSTDAARGILLGDLVVEANGKMVYDSLGLSGAIAGATDSVVQVATFRYAAGLKQLLPVSKRYLTSGYIKDIGPTARVIAVTEGGASDRAGMKVGDLIVRINGKTFKNSMEADQILAEGQVGKDLIYDVLRDNQVLSLHVIIAAIGVPFPLFVSTICGLFYFGAGIFLGLARPRYIAARLTGLSLLVSGYFLTVILIRRGIAVTSFQRIRDLTMIL